jgi:hypothetical protein
VTIGPAVEHDQAMPIRPSKAATIGPATEHSEAGVITSSARLAGTGVLKASGTVIGPGQPQAETIGEGIGVLGWVVSGIYLGYDIGHSVSGEVLGGILGGVVGGVAACTAIRWPPAREATFKFVRFLRDQKRD